MGPYKHVLSFVMPISINSLPTSINISTLVFHTLRDASVMKCTLDKKAKNGRRYNKGQKVVTVQSVTTHKTLLQTTNSKLRYFFSLNSDLTIN